jgi:phosphoenolpyruvate synthase/pyruvate phosphate dikinase
VFSEMQISVPFLLGTMIELPRAALTADENAARRSSSPSAPMTSPRPPGPLARRCRRFLPDYIDKNIIDNDLFQVLDVPGVGRLIQMACEMGGRPGRTCWASASTAGTGVGGSRQARHELRQCSRSVCRSRDSPRPGCRAR